MIKAELRCDMKINIGIRRVKLNNVLNITLFDDEQLNDAKPI